MCCTPSNCGFKLRPSNIIGSPARTPAQVGFWVNPGVVAILSISACGHVGAGHCYPRLQKHSENLAIANQEVPDARMDSMMRFWLVFVALCFLTLLSALDLVSWFSALDHFK
ncbi:hypothetical protein B0H10DRAFT_1977177 [Mycena sp. CBHHK59/15]|nr:hypothetical protein B0H10DRAFT_1977177 [Mycena sp. CBHHK59/15]